MLFRSSTSNLDVSLHGGIPAGRPLDGKKNKVFSQLWATFTYLAKEGALGGASTSQRTLYGFKGGMINFLIWTLPSPTQPFALKYDDSGICDVTSMVSKGYSIFLGQQMMLPHMMQISQYDKRLLTMLHTLEKLWKFSMGNTFQKEVDLHLQIGRASCRERVSSPV